MQSREEILCLASCIKHSAAIEREVNARIEVLSIFQVPDLMTRGMPLINVTPVKGGRALYQTSRDRVDLAILIMLCIALKSSGGCGHEPEEGNQRLRKPCFLRIVAKRKIGV